MIRPDHIAFDIDGVFANTMGLFLEIAKKEYGINHVEYGHITRYWLEECLDIPPGIIQEIINRILEGDFELELEPIEGAVEVLSEIARSRPLLFVTARPTLSPIKGWVEEMLHQVPSPIEVVATGAFEAKADVLRAKDIRYFVDDCLDICFMLEKQGITPLLYSQPWNRFSHPFREVTNWAELRALMHIHPA
jgi:hypothetical protein